MKILSLIFQILIIEVSYSNHTNIWSISNKSYSNVKIDDEFGTSRINALHILEKTLNLRDCKVFDKVQDESGKEKSILNMEETALALEKTRTFKKNFKIGYLETQKEEILQFQR